MPRALLRGALGLQAPLYVQLAITRRCNLACRMCNSTASRQADLELSLPQLDQLATVLAELGPGVLVLTGGEPFARADLLEAFQVFVRHGLRPRLQTNGTLATESRVRALVQAGLREITLSLDSLDPARQDAINGQPGSWLLTLEALERFSRLLPPRGSLSGVNIVVSRQNLHEVPQVVRFVDALGFWASLIPVHTLPDPSLKVVQPSSATPSTSLSQSHPQAPSSPLTSPSPGEAPANREEDGFIIRRAAEDFRFRPKDFPLIDQVYGQLLAMKAAGLRIQSSSRFLRASPAFLKHGQVAWRCDSPRLFFAISPDGRFLPCVDLPYPQSMLEAGFVEAYRSGRLAQALAERVKACQGCMYACWPEVSWLCTDPASLLDRGRQAYQVNRRSRPRLSLNQILELAARYCGQTPSSPV